MVKIYLDVYQDWENVGVNDCLDLLSVARGDVRDGPACLIIIFWEQEIIFPASTIQVNICRHVSIIQGVFLLVPPLKSLSVSW